MARQIDVRKTVYGSEKYKEVVDTNFSSFGANNDGALPISVEEFFSLYEDLYLDIPLTDDGDGISHTALINRSSELVNVDTENAENALLFQEINELREQVASGSARVAELEQGSLEALELERQVGTLKSQLEEIRDLASEDGTKRRRFINIEEFLNREGI